MINRSCFTRVRFPGAIVPLSDPLRGERSRYMRAFFFVCLLRPKSFRQRPNRSGYPGRFGVAKRDRRGWEKLALLRRNLALVSLAVLFLLCCKVLSPRALADDYQKGSVDLEFNHQPGEQAYLTFTRRDGFKPAERLGVGVEASVNGDRGVTPEPSAQGESGAKNASDDDNSDGGAAAAESEVKLEFKLGSNTLNVTPSGKLLNGEDASALSGDYIPQKPGSIAPRGESSLGGARCRAKPRLRRSPGEARACPGR